MSEERSLSRRQGPAYCGALEDSRNSQTGIRAMTIAEWCILLSVLLYLLTVAPFKPLFHREFDNSNPRAPQFYAAGIRSRALGAHLNGIETFPFFAVAIVVAEFKSGPQYWIDMLAVAFVIMRLVFVGLYFANRATLRTIVWNIGFALNVAIFVSPLFPR
jgi:uncharacterized MAPEG superfamily protein